MPAEYLSIWTGWACTWDSSMKCLCSLFPHPRSTMTLGWEISCLCWGPLDLRKEPGRKTASWAQSCEGSETWTFPNWWISLNSLSQDPDIVSFCSPGQWGVCSYWVLNTNSLKDSRCVSRAHNESASPCRSYVVHQAVRERVAAALDFQSSFL